MVTMFARQTRCTTCASKHGGRPHLCHGRLPAAKGRHTMVSYTTSAAVISMKNSRRPFMSIALDSTGGTTHATVPPARMPRRLPREMPSATRRGLWSASALVGLRLPWRSSGAHKEVLYGLRAVHVILPRGSWSLAVCLGWPMSFSSATPSCCRSWVPSAMWRRLAETTLVFPHVQISCRQWFQCRERRNRDQGAALSCYGRCRGDASCHGCPVVRRSITPLPRTLWRKAGRRHSLSCWAVRRPTKTVS
mmetsp:Transcript_90194/g.254442  ORF Transcript_90194/g.254442 Transcript_90194/m.254442 type:complete len:249 (+) Transcript_90194:531-1277(+)